MTELMEFTQAVAREAGGLIVLEREQADLTHDYKGGTELVTNADIMADELIRSRIEQQFPAHLILSEESSPELQRVWESDAPVWIVDPIDGTRAFIAGKPIFGTLVALCDKGFPLLGLIDMPCLDEMYIGYFDESLKYSSVTLNGSEISASKRIELSQASRSSPMAFTHFSSPSSAP